MTPPLLSIENLTAGYGKVEVLHGLGLSLAAGEVGVILGANGAGKTTLLRAISGEVRRGGTIRFDGRPIERLRPESVSRLGIAHVPDDRGTFADLSVDENLRLGAYRVAGDAACRAGMARVFQYFPRLAERRGQQAGTLSGGEQQMLAIGRALMMQPRLLVLDEPSFGLAPMIVQDIYGILKTIRKEERTTMLIVEQHAHVALALADTAHVLGLGRFTLSGDARTVAADPATRRSYLGD